MGPTALTKKQEILLIYIDLPTELDPGGAIDRIRIMKGLFVFAQEIEDKDWIQREALYEFEPYNFGPCSFDIYSDLDILNSFGYIHETSLPNEETKYYRCSVAGHAQAQMLAKNFDEKAISYLKSLKEFFSRLPFEEVLKKVYKKYPAYATKSVFQY